LHYLLVLLTTQVVDPTVSATFVRLPSALAGAFTPLLTYGLGRELFGKAQGLLGALLVAFSMTFLEYSQDLRPYAIFTMLTCLSVYCLLVAARTRKAGWWLAFTLAVIANMYNSYVAITMALPPLILMLLWLALRLWREKGKSRRSVLYAGTSLLAIGLASIPLLLDMLRVPRALVNLGSLSLDSTLSLLVVITNWYTEFDLDGQWATVASALTLVLALYGVYSAVRGGHNRGIAIYGLFLLLPLLIMSLLMTSNFVTQRYVLFGLPFYLLLISHALISFTTSGNAKEIEAIHNSQFTTHNSIRFAPALVVGLVFAVGAYNYTTIDNVDSVPSRADFRAATRYISESAGPEDVIVFADNYARGLTVSNFYWHGSPPSPLYDARDTRLTTHERKGSIYWVVSRLGSEWLGSLSTPEQGWAEVQPFLDGVVLREDSTNTTMLESLERMVEKNEAIRPEHGFTKTLRGCVYQAQGDVPKAVSAYIAANTNSNPILGGEYLRTATGFEIRGDIVEAWREASVSKALYPASSDLHRWMSGQLTEEGYSDQSQVETQIADALEIQR
ncbi:MAG: glycosyltransferase family 39 protein, partial [Chloroflexia bacterium]